MTSHPQTVAVLDELRRNCYLGKHRHFLASSRTNKFHIWFGLPGIIISVVLGSTFFVLISKEIPVEAKWAAAFAGLVAAVLGAIQTFFNFQKISESHRTIANQYLGIQRDCEQLIARYCDELLPLADLAESLSDLNARYCEVAKSAESLRTNKDDYARALMELDELEAHYATRGYLLRRGDVENPNNTTEPTQ